MNACHSAREQTHPSIPYNYRIGFIDLFLKKGARGVIGTLGKVGLRSCTITKKFRKPDFEGPKPY